MEIWYKLLSDEGFRIALAFVVALPLFIFHMLIRFTYGRGPDGIWTNRPLRKKVFQVSLVSAIIPLFFVLFFTAVVYKIDILGNIMCSFVANFTIMGLVVIGRKAWAPRISSVDTADSHPIDPQNLSLRTLLRECFFLKPAPESLMAHFAFQCVYIVFFLFTYSIFVWAKHEVWFITLFAGMWIYLSRPLPKTENSKNVDEAIISSEVEKILKRYAKCIVIGTVMLFPLYQLNQWIKMQSDEIQSTVTIGLPILYVLIYFVLNHKKKTREL